MTCLYARLSPTSVVKMPMTLIAPLRLLVEYSALRAEQSNIGAYSCRDAICKSTRVVFKTSHLVLREVVRCEWRLGLENQVGCKKLVLVVFEIYRKFQVHSQCI
jgi:hypothetical protein